MKHLTDKEMEETLIGSVLMLPKTMREATFLEPDDFSFDILQILWAEMRRRHNAGQKIDPSSLAQTLAVELEPFGGFPFLIKLRSMCFAEPSVGDWAHTLKDLSAKRRLLLLLEEQLRTLNDPTQRGTVEELTSTLLTELERQSANASPRLRTEQQTRIHEAEGMKKPILCYSTGFHCLDDAMGGGLHAGKAYGIFARMKAGKSLMAGQISHHLNRSGTPHLFIACEMGSAEIEHRAMAEELGVNALAFLDPRWRNNPEFNSRVGQVAITSPGNIHYLDAPGLTIDQLKRDVTHAVLGKGARGFVLDYLQLVGGQRKGQTKAEHLDDICQWVAEICRKRNIWALVLGQMNQEGNTRGGEGVRLAFDQVYEIKRQQGEASGAWLEMIVTRYTKWSAVGSDTTPALYLDEKVGPRFTEAQMGMAAE